MYVPVAGRWVLGDGNRQASPLVDGIHGKSSAECVGEARLFADVHLHDVIALGCSLTTYLRQSSLRRSARLLAATLHGPSSQTRAWSVRHGELRLPESDSEILTHVAALI